MFRRVPGSIFYRPPSCSMTLLCIKCYREARDGEEREGGGKRKEGRKEGNEGEREGGREGGREGWRKGKQKFVYLLTIECPETILFFFFSPHPKARKYPSNHSQLPSLQDS